MAILQRNSHVLSYLEQGLETLALIFYSLILQNYELYKKAGIKSLFVERCYYRDERGIIMNLKDTIDEIVKSLHIDVEVPEISNIRNYWLVRTDSGLWFEEFSNEGYVAVGWDKLKDENNFSLDNKEEAIKIIEKLYPDNSAGHIYGTLNRFRSELDVGDVIMIPSEKSETINFGIINSDEYFAEVSDTEVDMDSCPYRRRRNVKWLKKVYRKQLEPQLFKMMQSHHTITTATDYDLYIDKTLNSLYVKNEVLHSVFNVQIDRDLSYNALRKLVNLPDFVNEIVFEDSEGLTFESKIRLQSPGDWLLMATENAALRLLIISLFIKQALVGGEIKLLGFSMNNEPLLDILRRNGLGVSKKGEDEINEKADDIQDLSKELILKAPSENSESNKKSD